MNTRHVVFFVALASLATSLGCQSIFQPTLPPPIPRVLMIGIGGLRPDALTASEAPNLALLMENGCYSALAQASAHTTSGAGWSSVLTGVWPDKHGGVDDELKGTHFDRYPHIFSRLKAARPEAVTGSFVDWPPIDRKILPTAGADVRWCCDVRDRGDEQVAAKASEVLLTHNLDFAFVFFGDVVESGREHGFHPGVTEYAAAVKRVDAHVGRLLDALRARPMIAREDWLVLVTTDHGGTIDGQAGRDEPLHRNTLAIVSGATARRGRLVENVNQVDLVVTALAHLNVAIDPAWQLDGRKIGLARNVARYGDNLIYNGNAELSSGHDAPTQNAGVAGWIDLGAMTVVPHGVVLEIPGATLASSLGERLFSGGASKLSRIAQVIDLEPFVADIDQDRVAFDFAAYLGGHADQRDQASVHAEILDANGGVLARTQLGPVTLAMRRAASPDRPAGKTGLWQQATTGRMPKAARSVRITLLAEAADEDNRGYADDLTFVLKTN
ncbi:MAG: alkaline phosphatase family protein [Planctomycetota bacterium]